MKSTLLVNWPWLSPYHPSWHPKYIYIYIESQWITYTYVCIYVYVYTVYIYCVYVYLYIYTVFYIYTYTVYLSLLYNLYRQVRFWFHNISLQVNKKDQLHGDRLRRLVHPLVIPKNWPCFFVGKPLMRTAPPSETSMPCFNCWVKTVPQSPVLMEVTCRPGQYMIHKTSTSKISTVPARKTT